VDAAGRDERETALRERFLWANERRPRHAYTLKRTTRVSPSLIR
jgi:hypothetical protein